ncbi:hypothetical protein LOZ51_002844 [Ophidiomyces ophidiicola]|nr:hypothetical protein LOZ54_001169 [Ophidiomyces ophidiicola]KAI1998166.1 hypothetical protein LOZ51_002844 [Ophidiomyces ophidiicola]
MANEVKSSTDVLIIGAGPSGLAAALWLAKLGVSFRVVDKRADQPRAGQADGLNPKTMEIFESFGIHGKVTKRWEPATDETVWCRGEDGKLVRTERYRNHPPPGVRWTHGTLQQGRVEEIIKKHIFKLSDTSVEYDSCLVDLAIDTAENDISRSTGCTACVQRGASMETIRAQYVIGADGGRSYTRQLLGFDMQGETGSSIWGVMDFCGESDFPDFGTTSIIRSNTEGAVDFVRREDCLIRMYVELNKGREGEGITREAITPELIIDKCQRMLRPYKLGVHHYVWWSAFTATQRLSSALSSHRRVFLVGDAVHTHSPITGMGMNTSIQDSYNLGWKLAGVIQGQLKPEILQSYDTERGAVATQLIDADRTTLELFSARMGHEARELLERGDALRIFLAGRGTRYDDPLLTSSQPQRMGVFKPGECLPDVSICNHATGRASSLHNVLETDGRWCLIVFSGDVSVDSQMQRVHTLADQIKTAWADGSTDRLDLLDMILVHCAPWDAIELADFPTFLFPPREYGKIFIDEASTYEELGLDQKEGGLVLVRPDRHIGWVGASNGFNSLNRYLSRVFQQLPQV